MDSGWTDFFTTCAQASVTLFSVLFVAMQVRHEEWRGTALRTMAAISALGELCVPTLASLIIVMPRHPAHVAGLVAGAFGLGIVAMHAWVFNTRPEGKDEFDRRQMRWSALSVIVYGSVAASGLLDEKVGPYVLAACCVWLLFSGSFEAWYVLDAKGLARHAASEPNGDVEVRPSSQVQSGL